MGHGRRKGGLKSARNDPFAGDAPGAVADIVVQASSPGLDVVELTIPVSTDAVADSVLAVATKSAGRRVEF